MDMSQKLFLSNIQPTSTILQMENQIVAKLEGIVEDVQITLDSWNYLMDFLLLKIISQPFRYLVILDKPRLATIVAYINYRSGDMIISNGQNTKTFSLYPPVQPTLDYLNQIWIDEPDRDAHETFATLATITIKDHVEEIFHEKYTIYL